MPSFEWQRTQRSKGSAMRMRSTFDACGLWQFEHFLSFVTASCCTRLFASWFLMPAWHFRQSETSSSPSRAGSTELCALWQSVHASTAGTCLYLRAITSRTSSWHE